MNYELDIVDGDEIPMPAVLEILSNVKWFEPIPMVISQPLIFGQ
jgi:hypothetical protein